MSAASLVRLLVLAAIWGGSFLFMRVASPVLGAAPTAFARVTLGALGLLAVLAASRKAPLFEGKFAATLALGVINSGIPFLMFSLAARVLPAGYSSILNGTVPLMGVLIGVAFFNERATVSKLAGVAVGLSGVVVLSEPGGQGSLGSAALWGIAACLLATACYAVAGFLTNRWIVQRGGLDSRIVAFGSQIGAVLMLLPFAAWNAALADTSAWLQAGPGVWGALLALGLVSTALAYVLYFRLIADEGPFKAMMVAFLIPPFGVLWGWLVLGESVSLAQALGGGMIATALWLVLRPAPPKGEVSRA